MSFTRLLKRIATGSSDVEKPKSVGITSTLKSISVVHQGEVVVIKRNPNPEAVIPSLFNRVSRPCPPFCVQPMKVAENVETIGELELLDYLQESKKGSAIVVDSRLKSWEKKGTIPGAIHIPWTQLVVEEGASLETVLNIFMQHFSVKYRDGKSIADVEAALENYTINKVLDFSNAKVVALFCNGTWCGQTSESIKSLLAFGYPAEKLKYYRDGMQGWVSLGLTTIMDKEICKLVK